MIIKKWFTLNVQPKGSLPSNLRNSNQMGMGWTNGSTCKLGFTLDLVRVFLRFSNLVHMVLMVEIKVSRMVDSTTLEDLP